MLARQRQEFILERVAATGGIRVAEVVEALGISEMTVRRDITELVSQGLVERVHGGAVAAGSTTNEPRFTSKTTLHPQAKARIGAAAAALVRPGDSLALSAGTTTLAVANAITKLEHLATLTIITNSLPAAQLLFDAADAARAESREAPSVLLIGGERTRSNAMVGLIANDALARLRVEWVFLGAHGFEPSDGMMAPSLREAATNQALVTAGRTTVACLDASKWGVLGLRTFCPTEQIGVLVTDAQPDEATVTALDEAGTTLIVAP
ncbi:Lactose phosphotransferase system repressor [Actinomyces bovis]|uniref:Lactose phosphotransferase system repressor n=1 Tax=Actinomyces bovis TaxID=1658 RepID=A0ABY1VMW9_9ACTO|nr:DeoR/GlpR family DNA-binding transcription regulator [Actinomyces bovis]SPT53449.1 Lactose phosphotransferase system repressor [Actinomyces bovis]VEG52926.1 Lactose phosphotransferase system repressor [Actinomyces israelii]